MNPKIKKAIFIPLAAILIISLCIYIIHGNTALEVTEITVRRGDIPKAFDGYKIAHISDLHSAEFGEGNETLIKMLSEISPDIIVMTGDLFDPRYGDLSVCLDFSKQAAKIAPTYMVSGNHDETHRKSEDYNFEVMKKELVDIGVTVLSGERIYLEKDGERIALAGIDDPIVLVREEFDRDYIARRGEDRDVTLKAINSLPQTDDSFTVLLAHRPDYFDIYADYGADLVFSGHAHGGQFRIPLIGGLYAPGQGLFPKYTEGIQALDSTDMIVSRGLGNASFPFRFNNRPEIVVATLESGD